MSINIFDAVNLNMFSRFPGSKWTLSQLRSYFKRQNVDDYALWQQIWSIMVLTIIGDGKLISSQTWEDNGFQFVGFDILVDGNLKPHLLEVPILNDPQIVNC